MAEEKRDETVQEAVERLWAAADAADSPFNYPDNMRNYHTNGAQCSMWGRSTADMNMDQLIMFVGMLDQLYSAEILAGNANVDDLKQAEVAEESDA